MLVAYPKRDVWVVKKRLYMGIKGELSTKITGLIHNLRELYTERGCEKRPFLRLYRPLPPVAGGEKKQISLA